MIFAIIILIITLLSLAGMTALLTAMIEHRHPPRGRLIPVTGGRLHVADHPAVDHSDAAHPPVVLLHGASGNLADMQLALADRLMPHHRVILIDRPGHGWSDRPGKDADASPAQQANLIAQALDRLGITRAIVVGHSWSGSLALAFALEYPTRVAALMLLAPVTHPWPGGIAWYYRLVSKPFIGPLFARTVALPLGLLLAGKGIREAFAPQSVPKDYVMHAAIYLVLRPKEFVDNARDVAGLKTFVAKQVFRYRDLTGPVVIVTGDCDRTVSPTIHSTVLAAAVPQAKLIVLPGIGHMVHHAAADLIAAEIDRLAGLHATPQG